jgi:hypothetical protein
VCKLLAAAVASSTVRRRATAAPVRNAPPGIDPRDRDGVLQLLGSLSQPQDARLVLGQNLGVAGEAAQNYTTTVMAMRPARADAGRLPLIGIDYGWGSLDVASMQLANRVAIEHVAAGGLVTLCWHPNSPFADAGRQGQDAVRLPRRESLATLLDHRHPAGREWSAQVERFAFGLQELLSAAVPVIIRPLHEANGHWFWWSPKAAADLPIDREREAFRQLWSELHARLSRLAGGDRLIWSFAAASGTDNQIDSPDACRPPPETCQLVGIDWYGDRTDLSDLSNDRHLAAVRSWGIPVGLSEFGPRDATRPTAAVPLVDFIRRQNPEFAWMHAWHSWTTLGGRKRMAWVDRPDWSQLLRSDGLLFARDGRLVG